MPLIKKNPFDQVVEVGKNLTLYVNNARIYARELFGDHNVYELSIEVLKDEGLQIQSFFDKPECYSFDDEPCEYEDLMDYGLEYNEWDSGDYEIYCSGPDDDYFEYIDDIYIYDE